jgi:hypothetical protein
MFVRSCELAARRCSAIPLDRPNAGSTSIGASAQKIQGNYCTIYCTIPDSGRMTRGIIGNFFDLT